MMTPADRRVLLFYAKTTLKCIWYICLIPVAILGMFFVIPFLALRFIFYTMGIGTMATTVVGRKVIADMIHENTNPDLGGASDYLANGFNVDLERDFVGATQVRKSESIAGRVLQARKP